MQSLITCIRLVLSFCAFDFCFSQEPKEGRGPRGRKGKKREGEERHLKSYAPAIPPSLYKSLLLLNMTYIIHGNLEEAVVRSRNIAHMCANLLFH